MSKWVDEYSDVWVDYTLSDFMSARASLWGIELVNEYGGKWGDLRNGKLTSKEWLAMNIQIHMQEKY